MTNWNDSSSSNAMQIIFQYHWYNLRAKFFEIDNSKFQLLWIPDDAIDDIRSREEKKFFSTWNSQKNIAIYLHTVFPIDAIGAK